MLAPVADVLVVRHISAIWQRQVGHVLGALQHGAFDHLAVALENEPGDLLEAPIVQVLHDRDDRLLALADGYEVEVVDKCLGLTRGIWSANDCQRLAADLSGQRECLVLHRDHAVDSDHRRLELFDLFEDLVALEERVV